MAGKIFINYRRGDDPENTGRRFDRLQDVFEPGQLFMDVDNIAPGLDFVRELHERVADCPRPLHGYDPTGGSHGNPHPAKENSS